MQFKSGMLGACIVVIALLATVLLGFSLNISEGTDYKLKFEPITNVTGQFEGDNVPDYVQFNGAKNYTGYTFGTFTYTSASTANQYSVIADPGTDVNIGTVSLEADTTGYTTLGSWDLIGTNGGLWFYGGAQLTVAQYLTNNSINLNNYDYIVLDLTGGSTPFSPNWYPPDYPLEPYYNYYYTMNGVAVGTTPQSDFTAYRYNWMGNQNELTLVISSNYATHKLSNGGLSPVAYWVDGLYLPYSTDPDNLASYLVIQRDGTLTYYRSGTNIFDDNGNLITVTNEAVFSSDVGNTYLNYSGSALQGGLGWIRDDPTAPYPSGGYSTHQVMKDYVSYTYSHYLDKTVNVKATGHQNVVYDYMRISDGVALTGASTWANDRVNGSIEWVVKFSAGDSLELTPSWSGSTAGALSLSYNGNFTAQVGGQTYNGGGWDIWDIKIDGLNGVVTLTPVTAFNDFQNYMLSSSSKVLNVPTWANGGITSVGLTSTGAPRFSVATTYINYDISKTSILNGSMNPRDYFPSADYSILKITFDSFAVIGDSVTINNEAYPVTDNYITIGSQRLALNGLSVVYNADSTISAENGKDSVNLGVSVDDTITFNGIWYFTARALSGYLSEEPTVIWDAGTWSTTFSQSIVLYEALIILGGIVARHYVNLKALDWVILIVAMLGGAVLV